MMRSFFGGVGQGLASSAPPDLEAERQKFGRQATISELGGLRPDPSPLRDDIPIERRQDRAAARRARVPIGLLPPSQVDREILPPTVRERGAAARRARLRLAGLVAGRRGLTGENDIRGGKQDTLRAADIARRKKTLGSSVVLGEKGG